MDGITFREAFSSLSIVFLALVGVTYRMFNKTLLLENRIIKDKLESQGIKIRNQRRRIEKLEKIIDKHHQMLSDIITTDKYKR